MVSLQFKFTGEMLIKARGRVKTERVRNSKFSFRTQDQFNSYAETTLFKNVLGDQKTGTVSLDFIKIFFGEILVNVRLTISLMVV
jgi:hypothetical protein